MKNIFIAICLALALFTLTGIGAYSSIVRTEENVREAYSNVNVQEKRRVDLLYNLVDCVKSYNDHEANTLLQIVNARQDNATMELKAVVENYPDLKSSANYQSLMNELSITENLISQYRSEYNYQVKEYKSKVLAPLTNIVLRLVGYEIVQFDYLNFNVSPDAPQNLFGGN